MGGDAPALLLIGHGSRADGVTDEMMALVHLLRTRVAGRVSQGWIELTHPPANEAAEHLIQTGARSLVLVPLLLFPAYHARVDLPGIADEVTSRHPDVTVRIADPLGADPALVDLAAGRVHAAEKHERADALLVVGSGSSDGGAQAQLAQAAQEVARRAGHHRFAHAFASVAEPDPATALHSLIDGGAARVVVFSWSLLVGRLVAEVEDVCHHIADERHVDLAWAGRLGPDGVVADVLATRYRDAAGS